MRRLSPGIMRRDDVRRAIRRRETPRGIRIMARSVAVVVLAVGAPIWLWHAHWVAAGTLLHRTASTSAAPRLAVREVLLEGRLHTPREKIIHAVGVRPGDPMIGIDPGAVRRRLESISWVRHAAVERRFPGTLYLRIVERKPMALWQRDGRLTLVGRDGTPITDRDLGRFAGLIVIAGRDAPRDAPKLFAVLATQPRLNARVRAAIRVGGRRWNIQFDSGIELRLPENEPAAAWSRLGELQQRHGLLARNLEIIDLRLPDRLMIRPGRDHLLAGIPGERI